MLYQSCRQWATAFFILFICALIPSWAGPQHWGFGMSYLAALENQGGQRNLVIYEGPLRAKNTAWISRWMERSGSFGNVVQGGIAIGNFWPAAFGKEYLAVVVQNGSSLSLKILNPPELFSARNWDVLSASSLPSETVVAVSAGDLLGQNKDQLLLLAQSGTDLKLIILTPPSTSTGTTWTVAKQATLPAMSGSFRGFAVGDFWDENKDTIALATNDNGTTKLNFYQYNSSANNFTLITSDAATALPTSPLTA